MSQKTQALQVIKDLSRVKTQLLKDRLELNSILQIGNVNSDGSIPPTTWFALNFVRTKIDEMVVAIDRAYEATKDKD